MKQFVLLLALNTSTIALVGCGTPAPVLNQARHLTGLSSALQSEIEEYRRTQALIAEQRIENVRAQLAMVARNEMRATYSDRIDEAIGNTEPRRLYKQLLDLAVARAEGERVRESKLRQLDDQLSKLLVPLPETNLKLAATQKAVIPLSEDLSSSERINALTGFAKAVRDGVDKAKKKIADAEKATPAPPAQTSE